MFIKPTTDQFARVSSHASSQILSCLEWSFRTLSAWGWWLMSGGSLDDTSRKLGLLGSSSDSLSLGLRDAWLHWFSFWLIQWFTAFTSKTLTSIDSYFVFHDYKMCLCGRSLSKHFAHLPYFIWPWHLIDFPHLHLLSLFPFALINFLSDICDMSMKCGLTLPTGRSHPHPHCPQNDAYGWV